MQLSERDANQRIECFCSRHPLLALAGRDSKTGLAFVWVKTVKGEQIMAEIIVINGTVRIRCRHCLRFHAVTVSQGTPKIYEIRIADDRDLASDLK